LNKVGLDYAVPLRQGSSAAFAQTPGRTRDQIRDATPFAWVHGQCLRTWPCAPNKDSRESGTASNANSRADRSALMAQAGKKIPRTIGHRRRSQRREVDCSLLSRQNAFFTNIPHPGQEMTGIPQSRIQG